MLKWGECFYRRDGNDTPKSLVPEVAALQELFAEVLSKHQDTNRQWREDFAKFLLGLEAAHSELPQLTREYRNFFSTFDIPFTTDKYKKWVRFAFCLTKILRFNVNLFQWNTAYKLYDEVDLPINMISPFEMKFFDLTREIHMAVYERQLDAARNGDK